MIDDVIEKMVIISEGFEFIGVEDGAVSIYSLINGSYKIPQMTYSQYKNKREKLMSLIGFYASYNDEDSYYSTIKNVKKMDKEYRSSVVDKDLDEI
jgi:hypothetical protein